tara:strand:+ start:192 stop:365 length:174 start_codon:yes stop_codon:yes gene_type:complete
MKYFNIKTNQGVETVDYIDRKEFATFKEYITELKRLKNEYHICGMNVYISQRSAKDY